MLNDKKIENHPVSTYLLDTSAINRILDGEFDVSDLPRNSEFAITHIQVDEINDTSSKERRAQLSLMQSKIRPHVLCTESFVLDISRLSNAKLGDGVVYKEVLAGLNSRSKRRKNNIKDALICEVAIINGYTLITADQDLADVALVNGLSNFFLLITG